jgi:hypothetical protein
MAKRTEPDIDPRVEHLSPEAKRCRARGRHNYPELEDVLRDALRHNKGLVNMREITLDLQCKCGVSVKESVDAWTGQTIGRNNNYSQAKDYLMPFGTGRLARTDVRAAVIRDVFGGASRRR